MVTAPIGCGPRHQASQPSNRKSQLKATKRPLPASQRVNAESRRLTGALRRSILTVAGLAAAAVLAVGLASPASAYGGGANHDMWQIGLSMNCNNPSLSLCA